MALVLDLLRHGEAEPSTPAGDDGRRLTPAGRAAIAALARRLLRVDWRPDRAFASPLLRAVETASLVLVDVPGVTAVSLPALESALDPRELFDALIDEGATDGRILLVGHQPLLGRAAAELSGEADVPLSPGTLVTLDAPRGFTPGTARIVRSIRPAAAL